MGLSTLAKGERGSNRVKRGGSWNNDARNVRVANRNNNDPGNRNNNLGFRLVSSRRDGQTGGVQGLHPRARVLTILPEPARPVPGPPAEDPRPRPGW